MKRSSFSFYAYYFKQRWHVLAVGIGGLLLCAVADGLMVKNLQWITDLFSSDHFSNERITIFLSKDSHTALTRLFIFTLFIATLHFIGRKVWRRSLGAEPNRAASFMKRTLWKSVNKAPFERYSRTLSPGSVMNVAVADCNASMRIFGHTIIGLLDALLLIISLVVSLLTINVELTLWIVPDLLLHATYFIFNS